MTKNKTEGKGREVMNEMRWGNEKQLKRWRFGEDEGIDACVFLRWCVCLNLEIGEGEILYTLARMEHYLLCGVRGDGDLHFPRWIRLVFLIFFPFYYMKNVVGLGRQIVLPGGWVTRGVMEMECRIVFRRVKNCFLFEGR